MKLNLLQTLALAAVVSLIGSFIKVKIKFFQKYFIPAPVIGGLLFAVIMFIGNRTNLFEVSLDNTLTSMLLQMFFTATGFTFSIKSLKKSGIIGLKLGALILFVAFAQNIIAALIAPITGISSLLGITVGSMSMAGGPGNSAAFGPTIQNLGVQGATVAAVAAATAGLVIGSLIGGPTAKILISKFNLKYKKNSEVNIYLEDEKTGSFTLANNLLNSTLLILLAMGLGTFVVNFLNNLTGFSWPSYVGGLFVAAIITNIFELLGIHTESKFLDNIGNVSLNIFLTLTVMALEIWLLLDLALPLIVLLIMQALFMVLFAIFIIFPILGRDYDAAVMAAGMCGVGIGSTPNAVANMQSVIDDNGSSQVSMTILPPVVSIALSVLNPVIITLFIKFLSGM